jgi:hypothetical protein
VHLPHGIEMHRRVPIDPADVHFAAAQSGFVVDDTFSVAMLSSRWYSGADCFYILSKKDLSPNRPTRE